MGQIEVFNVLKNKMISGDDRFFSVRDVEKMMKNQGYSGGVVWSVRRNLLRLYEDGYLDSKMTNKVSNWKRLFRIKKNCLGVDD